MQKYKLFIIFFYTIFVMFNISASFIDNKIIERLQLSQTTLFTEFEANNKKNKNLEPWHRLCCQVTKDHNQNKPFSVSITPTKDSHEIEVSTYEKTDRYPTYQSKYIIEIILGSFSSNLSRLHRQKLIGILSGKEQNTSFNYTETDSSLSSWNPTKNLWMHQETIQHTALEK